MIAMTNNPAIRPMPSDRGPGFFATVPCDFAEKQGYRYETVNIYHNFSFTAQNWRWPLPFADVADRRIIDGFSPNLNKQLHVGHLRNLAIANAFAKMLPNWQFVALLGASLGVYQSARQNLARWFQFLDYQPDIYYDTLLPWDNDIVARQNGTGENEGCQVCVSEGQEIILFRSNLVEYICTAKERSFYVRESAKVHICPICGLKGFETRLPGCLDVGKSKILGRPTYSYHDLAFAATVKPDYYLTGHEQAERFRLLGLGERHLPMGLVCGSDGKKMKSRDGDAAPASTMMDAVIERLQQNVRTDKAPDLEKLAWNILCWNFLHCNRVKDVRFDPDKWSRPDAPGLYVSYTYARLKSAIDSIPTSHGWTAWSNPLAEKELTNAREVLREWKQLTNLDVRVLGYMEYSHYYLARSLEQMDVAPFANYIHEFCRVLADAYTKERIIKGRVHFQAVIILATERLRWCMQRLGMFPLTEV